MLPQSGHEDAAIGVDRLPGDVARLRPRQEADEAGDLLGRSAPSQGRGMAGAVSGLGGGAGLARDCSSSVSRCCAETGTPVIMAVAPITALRIKNVRRSISAGTSADSTSSAEPNGSS